MGIFDLFRRKPPPPKPLEEPEGPNPDYVFAHYALREIALHDPLRFLAIVASPDASGFMEAVLMDVANQCGRPTTFDAKSVKIHRVRAGDYPCAVIELPEPKDMAEAYMVALVVPMDSSADPSHENIQGRYFALEKGFSFSGQERTVLAEWDTSSHLNYGSGPPAKVEAFVAAINDHLCSSRN